MPDIFETPARFKPRMFVRVRMRVAVFVAIVVIVVVVPVLMTLRMVMIMAVLVRTGDVHVEFHPFDGGFFGAVYIEVITGQVEPGQLALKLVEVGAEIKERPDEHVAANAAEQIQVKRIHVEGIRGAFNQ